MLMKFRPDAKLDPVWLLKLVQSRGDLTFVPPAVLRIDLSRPESPESSARTSKQKSRPGTPSWWTARAQEGVVVPGFSREQILKETPPDPRAPGGIFDRLGQVLGLLARGLEGHV